MDLQVVIICRLSATENTCVCFVASVRTGLVHIVGCLGRKGQSRRQQRIDSVCSFDLTFIFIISKTDDRRMHRVSVYIYIYICVCENDCFNNFTDCLALVWRSWSRASWYNYENNQQDALYRLIYYSKSALHVSGDVFTHHQEHLTVFTVSGNTRASKST